MKFKQIFYPLMLHTNKYLEEFDLLIYNVMVSQPRITFMHPEKERERENGSMEHIQMHIYRYI